MKINMAEFHRPDEIDLILAMQPDDIMLEDYIVAMSEKLAEQSEAEVGA